MSIIYANVTVGAQNPITKEYPVSAMSVGTAAQSGHVSLAWDSSVVTNQNQLKAALRVLAAAVDANSGLARA